MNRTSSGRMLIALLALGTILCAAKASAPAEYPLVSSLQDPSTVAGDDFGSTVVLSGDASTYLVSSNSSVYLYKQQGGVWDNYPSSSIQAICPCLLSSDGSTAVLNGRVYSVQDGVLNQVADYKPFTSMALSADGQTVVAADSNQDVVNVFHEANGVWPTSPTLTINSPGSNPVGFGGGVAVSADGTTIIVSYQGAGANRIISAFIYSINSGQASATLVTTLSPAAQQINSVMLSGDGTTAFINALYDGIYPGIYAYTQVNGSWPSSPDAVLNNGDVTDNFAALALSNDGKTAIIAGSAGNTLNNNVYVYSQVNGAWQTVPTNTLSDPSQQTTMYDRYGYSASLSDDGQTLLVGDPQPGALGPPSHCGLPCGGTVMIDPGPGQAFVYSTDNIGNGNNIRLASSGSMGGGGGVFDWLSILGLLGVALMRLRRIPIEPVRMRA